MSRRQFNRGTMMLSGAAVMPPVPVSLKRGSDDAYETIISEFIRVEEQARASGLSGAGGAVSPVGQHLEGFISHLDMKVSPFETSSQVYRELRGFVKKQVRNAREKLTDKADALIQDSADSLAEPGEAKPDEQSDNAPEAPAGQAD